METIDGSVSLFSTFAFLCIFSVSLHLCLCLLFSASFCLSPLSLSFSFSEDFSQVLITYLVLVRPSETCCNQPGGNTSRLYRGSYSVLNNHCTPLFFMSCLPCHVLCSPLLMLLIGSHCFCSGFFHFWWFFL